MQPRSLIAPLQFKNKFVEDMPFSDYLLEPGVSKSLLSEFKNSPLDGLEWMMRDNDKPTRAMQIGKFVDDLIFNGGTEGWYYVYPNEYQLASGETKSGWDGKTLFCKDWNRQHADKPCFKQDEIDELNRMADAVLSDKFAAEIIKDTIPQASFFVRDEETGLLLKGRPDWAGAQRLIDLKCTASALTESFSKQIASLRYHVQAALYMDGCNEAGHEVTEFYFIAVQEKPKIRVNVRRLKCTSIDCGRELYRRELEQLAECVQRNSWPGYSGGSGKIEEITVPEWEMNRVMACEAIDMGA